MAIINEQLLFWDLTPEEKILKEVRALKDSHEKVRKGQFAKIGSNTKRITTLEEDVDIMKKGICGLVYEQRFHQLLSEHEALKHDVEVLKQMIYNKSENSYKIPKADFGTTFFRSNLGAI